MLVKPLVIDLGWGTLKSALVNLPDSAFVKPREASALRQSLVDRYVAAFRHVEAAALDEARTTLHDLATTLSTAVAPDHLAAAKALVDGQLAKLV